MKALFITHEGIGNSIFRSQVLEHCIDLQKSDIEFEILVFNGYPRLWKTSVYNLCYYQEIYSLPIRLQKALFIWIPFSFLYNSLLLLIFLIKNKKNYSFIHARTDYTAFTSYLLQPIHKLPVIWDCRGDSIDEIKLAISKKHSIYRFFSFYFTVSQKLYLVLNKKFSKYTIFVSDALQELILGNNIKINSLVVPCPVPEKLFYYSLDARQKKRNELGLSNSQLLFVYSGSMAGYQAIDLLVIFANKISNMMHKLLILTTEIDVFNSLYRHKFDSNTVVVMNVNYEEITSYYSASDFGVLFRDERMTNWVASPTKFGEYCLAGLQVVHNENVQQINQFTRILENGVYANSDTFVKSTESRRIEIAERSKLLFGRVNSSKKYLKFYKSIVENE
jgi:hypothetical protein